LEGVVHPISFGDRLRQMDFQGGFTIEVIEVGCFNRNGFTQFDDLAVVLSALAIEENYGITDF